MNCRPKLLILNYNSVIYTKENKSNIILLYVIVVIMDKQIRTRTNNLCFIVFIILFKHGRSKNKLHMMGNMVK